MASTPGNRKKFIDSLIKFMRTYGFDGVDFDWEYPSADDRGGKPDDGDNFVQLVKEMKEAFGGSYGMSVTLPTGYWYLRHFKVKEMEPYIGWYVSMYSYFVEMLTVSHRYNVMSYDIHGVWDSSNKNVGPYARPHSNLTEIDSGLQLLWRAGVKPENVALGLGFYGRSFTLSDPSCNKPGCPFSAGGAPGKCSKASGVLTNAEIKRIIDANDLEPMYDKTAAVKWITWDSDQWVSYDDETTLQQKKKYADDNCLGGTMIWAIDQNSADGESMNNFLGTTNAGVFAKDVVGSSLELKKAVKETQQGMACYTSFCNTECQAGFQVVASTRGQVADFQFDTSCKGEYFRDGAQYICCPSSALNNDGKEGHCLWRGYTGCGMSCHRGCNDNEIEIAANSAVGTMVTYPKGGLIEVAQTCTGGYQSYCCSNYDLSIMAGSAANTLKTIKYQAISANKLSTREIKARAAERELWILDGEPIDPKEYGGSVLSNSGAMGITDLYSGASGLDFIVGNGVGKASLKKYGPGGSTNEAVGVTKPEVRKVEGS
jgi:chitinase